MGWRDRAEEKETAKKKWSFLLSISSVNVTMTKAGLLCSSIVMWQHFG